jgi:hypothetical protein
MDGLSYLTALLSRQSDDLQRGELTLKLRVSPKNQFVLCI